MDNAKGAWREYRGWHGTWCENVVQAISRDLLAGAITRASRRPDTRSCCTCHDESVVEVPEGFGRSSAG